MWVRLIKAHEIHTGERLPIGHLLNCTCGYGKDLIENKAAEAYNGPRPPRKIKTDFFKPKLNGNTNQTNIK